MHTTEQAHSWRQLVSRTSSYLSALVLLHNRERSCDCSITVTQKHSSWRTRQVRRTSALICTSHRHSQMLCPPLLPCGSHITVPHPLVHSVPHSLVLCHTLCTVPHPLYYATPFVLCHTLCTVPHPFVLCHTPLYCATPTLAGLLFTPLCCTGEDSFVFSPTLDSPGGTRSMKEAGKMPFLPCSDPSSQSSSTLPVTVMCSPTCMYIRTYVHTCVLTFMQGGPLR